MTYGARSYGEAAFGDGAATFVNHGMGGTSAGSATTSAATSLNMAMTSTSNGTSSVPYSNMGPDSPGSMQSSRTATEVLGQGFGQAQVTRTGTQVLGRGFGAAQSSRIAVEVLQRSPISIGSGTATGSSTVVGHIKRPSVGAFYPDTVLDKGPSWYYRLEDGVGATTLVDETNHTTATTLGSPLFGPSAAVTTFANDGVTFNSTDDRLFVEPDQSPYPNGGGYLEVVFSMTTSANSFAYYQFTDVASTTIASGDYLELQVFWPRTDGVTTNQAVGFDFQTTANNTLRGASLSDHYGFAIHPDQDITARADNRWAYRRVLIGTAFNGQTINTYMLAAERNVAGTYRARFRNIVIKDSAGNIKRTIFAQDRTPAALTATATVSNGTLTSQTRVNLIDPANYTPVNTFSVEAWVKPTQTITVNGQSSTGTAGTAGQRYLFDPTHQTFLAGMGLSVGTNGISVYEHGDAYLPPVVSWSGTVTNWSHVVVTYTNRLARLYVNGVLVGTGVQSTRLMVFSPTLVGGNVSYGSYVGEADELAVYDTALSLSQIQSNYQAGISNEVRPTGEAIAYAEMSGGTAANAGGGASTLGEFTLGLSLLGGEAGGAGQQLVLAPSSGQSNGIATVTGDPNLAYKPVASVAGSATVTGSLALDIPTLSGSPSAGATFPGDAYFVGPRLRKQAYELPVSDVWDAEGDFSGANGAEWHNDKWLAIQQGPITSTKIVDVQTARGRMRIQQPIQGAGTSATAHLRSTPLSDFDQYFDSQMIAHQITGAAFFCFRSTGVLITGTNSLVGSARDGYTVQLAQGGLTSTTFTLSRVVAGTSTLLATGTRTGGLTAGSNEAWHIRAVGNRIQVKSWAQGTAEPSTYQIDVTDSTFTVGSSLLAVGQAYSGSNADAFFEQRFDNFTTVDVSTPLTGSPSGSATVTGQPGFAQLLSASASAEATVTGSITISVLRGSITAGADVTGTLNALVALNSTSTGTATLNATLSNVRDLVGTESSGSASVTADLTKPRELSSSVTAAATVTGDLSTHNLRARSDGSSTLAANLRLAFDYQGDAICFATVNGTLGLTFDFAATTVNAGSANTGNMTFPRDFGTASASGIATVTGDLVTYILDGTDAAGSATVTGTLRYLNDIVRLSSTINGEASVAGDTRMRFRFGQTSIAGTSTVVGVTVRTWFVDAAPAGSATVNFDTLTVHTIPPGAITGVATVNAEAVLDAKFGGTSAGSATILFLLSNRFLFGTASPQGTGVVTARLGLRPKDFEVAPSDGSAQVLGQLLVVNLALNGLSQGGRIPILNPTTGLPTGAFNNTLVAAHMGVSFFFGGVPFRSNGFAEVEAILLINDSGLIRGNSRLDVRLDRLSTEYEARPLGFATVPYAFLDRPQDMTAHVNDAYAGLGTWYPGGQFEGWTYVDANPTMAPYPDNLDPPHGAPGHVHVDGSQFRGESRFTRINTERRFKGAWDGTYTPFTRSATPNLPTDPWWKDPDQSGMTSGIRSFNGPLPGALKRRYQLNDPGQLGGWFVDADYRDKAMRAAPVGEARFDEPQSTVDMDLELKSSMKGIITGNAVVQALALLLSYRTFLATGNVTALRYLMNLKTGDTTKSANARVPITQANAELLVPVRKTAALFT